MSPDAPDLAASCGCGGRARRSGRGFRSWMMTSKAKNRAVLVAVVAAILGLVVVIVYMWTGYRNGTSQSPPQPLTTTRVPHRLPPNEPVKGNPANVSTLFPPTGIGPLAVNTTDASSAEMHHPQSVELEPPARRNLSIGEPSSDLHVMEHVRPVKLPPATEAPLDEAAADAMDETTPKLRHKWRHHSTGHFRARAPGLWDPHPRYAFSAFGRRFLLELTLDPPFLSPHLKVTTYRRHEGGELAETLRDSKSAVAEHGSCFYTGTVSGDPSSSVAVNLCHGMTGHIRTTDGSFFIEPIEAWKPHYPTPLHAIYRVKKPQPSHGTDSSRPDSSSCGVDDTMQKPSINYKKLQSTLDGATSSGLPSSLAGSGGGHSSVEDDYDEDDDDDEEDDELGNGARALKESQLGLGAGVPHSRIKRFSQKEGTSREYFLEVMVVADRKMIEYHGSELASYVLTLMSIVSRIYKDASIGNPMTVAVVNLIEADEDFSNPSRRSHHHKGTSATDMLRNFCSWQHKMNHYDDREPRHHDTALLLTREDICRNPALNKCDTLGLAELGTMCDHYSSCAIIEDNGLSAAFTIAHELGHVLNMPHDDDHRCKQFLGNTQVHNVMSRMLDHNTHPWSWSNCSRHYLTDFLETGRGKCLLDAPTKDENKRMSNNEEKLPGENFTEDRQCELVFGAGSKICSYMPVCSRLWCNTALGEEKEGCRTQHMPWADGTSCGDGLWCQKGKCVTQNRSALLPIDGGWGEWQRWSSCSRSCGGGIKKSERSCTRPTPANGGKYCVGDRVRYKSCRKNECPPGSRDFREVQCMNFNNNNFSIPGLPADVRWIPRYEGIVPQEQCKLYCQVAHSSAYYKIEDKVKDGTPCNPDTYDVCVNGICTAADCSHTINAYRPLAVDICGKCGGDNSTCSVIDGKYTEAYTYDYSKVVKIPAGASNVDVRESCYRESDRDKNYLALVDPGTGKYLLNGNFSISTSVKLLDYGGTAISYNGGDTMVERINITRPLTKDLIVMVLTVNKAYPPNVHYRYIVPHNKSTYRWKLKSEWSECDPLCQGVKSRKAVCVKETSGVVEEVPDNLCTGQHRPRPHTQRCNPHCSLRWKVMHQTPCSARCGKGTKTLVIHCVQELHTLNGGKSKFPVEDRYCKHLPHRPAREVPCEGPCITASWQYSEWSPCSATCGEGVQTRKAVCRSSEGLEVYPKACQGYRDIKFPSLEEKRTCNNQECPRWATGEWSPGPVPTAHPSLSSSPLVSPSTALLLPRTPPPPPSSRWSHSADIRDSYSFPLPRQSLNYRWRAGLWGPCSETCREEGERPGGYVRRLVACQDEYGRDANDSHCSHSEKPRDVTPCPHIPLCPKWSHGEWGPCNVSCGEGRQFREVGCRGSGGQVLADAKCSLSRKPYSARICSAVPCPTRFKGRRREKFVWKTGPWEKCSTTCGIGDQRRRVTCHKVSRTVPADSDHYDSFLRNPGPPQQHYCSAHHKPAEVQRCQITECPIVEYRWKTGKWKACSEPCGRKGKQRRLLSCVRIKRDGQMEPASKQLCPKALRPPARQKCNRHPCEYTSCEMLRESKWKDHGMQTELRDGEYRLMVGGISVSIFCHGMTSSQTPKEYLTLPTGERENFSEFYERRLLKPNSCPDGGLRRDDCECTIDSNGKGGLTVFSRVRINVTSMRIDTEDMTFARQIHGTRVAYGEAGDCYSSLDCPQGRFSINLKGTGLRVHSSMEWEGRGSGAAVHVSRKDDGQSVVGRCGGYCGACHPAGAPWIALDIMPRDGGGLR
ncbi:A disintegrin and metalloproteinase with thrombospondin motifs 9-like isoform X2 [Ischnura elegans]|uniref:A disintegrin and metalloproteinase with thrombospondin motifs 9-like isoform X2 n=1 Tax=Ischnura elegans TaxID=197161 RepID=UPI001ED86BB3|nr:A disintegrin and metalloproteinase with thrombospondin motifs 9-like isoform X2 [Ischnura elegans]